MSSEKLSTRIAVIMSSSVFLILSSIVFYKAMTFDLNTLLYALQIAGAGALAAGILGFFMGNIFESAGGIPRKKSFSRENESLIDDLLVDDMQKLEKEIK